MKNKTKTNSLKSFFQRLFSQNKHPTPPSSVSDGVFITRDPNYKRTEVRSVPVFFFSIEETISDEDANKQLGNSKCFLIGSESIEQPKNTPKTAFSLMAIGKKIPPEEAQGENLRERLKEQIDAIPNETLPHAAQLLNYLIPMCYDLNQTRVLQFVFYGGANFQRQLPYRSSNVECFVGGSDEERAKKRMIVGNALKVKLNGRIRGDMRKIKGKRVWEEVCDVLIAHKSCFKYIPKAKLFYDIFKDFFDDNIGTFTDKTFKKMVPRLREAGIKCAYETAEQVKRKRMRRKNVRY